MQNINFKFIEKVAFRSKIKKKKPGMVFVYFAINPQTRKFTDN